MAGSLIPTKVVSLPKLVQELAINGEEPPPRYFFRDGKDAPIKASPLLSSIPIINLGLLSSSSSSPSANEELEKLRSALSSWGCFQAIGHGISSSFLDEVHEISKGFFKLPLEEKKKYSTTVDELQGYGNDPVITEEQILDWSDRLYLFVHPEDQRKLKIWPETPNGFREILHEYSMNMKSIAELLYKGMARSLNLEENSFSSQLGERATFLARFNYYPPCPRPDLVLGLKPHSDFSVLAIVMPDKEVEGLQVLIDDQWVTVSTIPHALLISMGDQMEIMSNGIFKSPVHRVVTNSERDRISLAVFHSPEPEKEIGPVDALVSEERPRSEPSEWCSTSDLLHQLGIFSMELDLELQEQTLDLVDEAMAESPIPTKVVSLSKLVQELAIDGKEPPARYFFRDGKDAPIKTSPLLSSIPVIDFGLLSSSSSSPSAKEELEKLRSALSSWGCFQAIGHGISSSLLDEVHEVAKGFFKLPLEEKKKYSTTVDELEGYGNDHVLTEEQILDWSDRLYLYVHPGDQRKLQIWPETPNGFREILHEYSENMKTIIELLYKVMARSLNLEENSFSSQLGERTTMLARFNYYPPCPRPDLVLGMKPHADFSVVTIIKQDKEVEGLQVLVDDQWIMSNGIFKSPVHRVVTNSERERISLAVFQSPEPEKEIGPADGLVGDERPRLFKKVKNYSDSAFEYFQRGKRGIDSAKI
ncbi:hypothetical protein HHK36_021372 [Tetracentron sinense]|uniref:Fe2OG dioxygenase domain-containing protein n=1 Tax=Tetracentron sinense TaxID=13715 RepID=A0A834YU23_TETSI|nr:hypothetical protein HHK36_021372 [Tetracentron sinense]